SPAPEIFGESQSQVSACSPSSTGSDVESSSGEVADSDSAVATSFATSLDSVGSDTAGALQPVSATTSAVTATAQRARGMKRPRLTSVVAVSAARYRKCVITFLSCCETT